MPCGCHEHHSRSWHGCEGKHYGHSYCGHGHGHSHGFGHNSNRDISCVHGNGYRGEYGHGGKNWHGCGRHHHEHGHHRHGFEHLHMLGIDCNGSNSNEDGDGHSRETEVELSQTLSSRLDRIAALLDTVLAMAADKEEKRLDAKTTPKEK